MKFILDCPSVKDITDNGFMHLISGFDLTSKIHNSLPIAEKIKVIEGLVKKSNKNDIIFIGLNSDQDVKQKINEATQLGAIGDNISIMLEPRLENVKICNELILRGILTSLSPCTSVSQAIIFVKSGVNFIFCPIGRMEDSSVNGIELIVEIKNIIENYPDFKTQIVTRSIRSLIHINESAKVAVDATCVSNVILSKMVNNLYI